MKKFLNMMFAPSKVITPDWVSKRERRVRLVSLYAVGLLLYVTLYVMLATLWNLVTHEVELPLWRSAVIIILSGIGSLVLWHVVPKKSTWIKRLEMRRSK